MSDPCKEDETLETSARSSQDAQRIGMTTKDEETEEIRKPEGMGERTTEVEDGKPSIKEVTAREEERKPDRKKLTTVGEKVEDRKEVESVEELNPSGRKLVTKVNDMVQKRTKWTDGDGGQEEGRHHPLTTFEDLLEVVGENGRWNVLMFLMCALVGFGSPLREMSYQFLGATPDHWCLVPQLVTANWTQHQVLSLAIPYSNATGDYESCRMYDYDYDQVAAMGYEAAMANRSSLTTFSDSPIECEARDFNRTQYQSTVVTEWDLVCDRLPLYSTTQGVAMAGEMVGAAVFGNIIGIWGRRPVILLTSIFAIVFNFLLVASSSAEMYISLKFVTTFLNAGQYLPLFIFAMEICAVRYRAAAGALFTIPWSLGYMAVPVIAYFIREWRWLQFAYAIPTLYGLIYIVWLPESPRWLITQARFKEARKVLTWAARVNKKTLPHDSVVLAAMASIHKQSTLEEAPAGRAGTGPWWVEAWAGVVGSLKHLVILLITPQFRVRTLIVFFCWFSSFIVYYGVAFNAINLGTNPYLYVFLGGLLEIPSYLLLLWPVMVFIGRKKSMMMLFLVVGICIFSVMTLQLLNSEGSEGAMVGLSQAGKMAVTAVAQLICAYTAELYPTRLRALAVAEAAIFGMFGSLCAPYVNDLMGLAAVWSPSALFGTLAVVSGLLAIFLPETRHADLPETSHITSRRVAGGREEEGGGGGQEDQEREVRESARREASAVENINNGTDNPAFVSDP